MSETTITETLSDGSRVEVTFYAYGAEDRCRYTYTITQANGSRAGDMTTGFDLYSGSGASVDAPAMLRTLCGFLSAWCEAIAYGPDSENRDLFPDMLAEWAITNEDELIMLSADFGV